MHVHTWWLFCRRHCDRGMKWCDSHRDSETTCWLPACRSWTPAVHCSFTQLNVRSSTAVIMHASCALHLYLLNSHKLYGNLPVESYRWLLACNVYYVLHLVVLLCLQYRPSVSAVNADLLSSICLSVHIGDQYVATAPNSKLY